MTPYPFYAFQLCFLAATEGDKCLNDSREIQGKGKCCVCPYEIESNEYEVWLECRTDKPTNLCNKYKMQAT